MNELPPDLLAALPDGAKPVTERWWASLSEADRHRIVGLWDDRLEVRFFEPQADAAGCVDEWDHVPTVRGGRFVPKDDDGRSEWTPGYFEHLFQHPELVMAYEPPRRVVHICALHPAARFCIEAGVVPTAFECPIRSAACPLVP
jgi:hypothetical protein